MVAAICCALAFDGLQDDTKFYLYTMCIMEVIKKIMIALSTDYSNS